MIVRRDVLKGVAVGAGLVLANVARAQTPPPAQMARFLPQSILDIARAFAKSPFKGPPTDLPDPFSSLNYDQYVGMRYRRDRAIWVDDKVGFVIEPLHRGFIFNARVDINLVEDGLSRRLAYDPADFDFGSIQAPAKVGDIGFSGFRVLAMQNDKLAEVAIFQGASFFRSRAPGQTFGVQARGLSLKTGDPRGEEIPIFKAVWIEKPTLANNALVIHALLDSESVAGAYRITIRPGEAIIIDTEMTLVPRASVENVGIATMTATSISTPLQRRRPDDVRPRIAEANGLNMLSGNGEWIWRPVTNRSTLQISSFVDENPKGFGFLQRERDFEAYQDDEAKWETRPTLWIEPLADFGKGNVSLIEIPAESETNSNCLAYWRPDAGIVAGREVSWAYRQFWCWEPPARPPQLTVFESRGGRGSASKRRRFIVAFTGDALSDQQLLREPKPALSLSPGTVASVRAYLYRDRKLYRVVFEIDPGGELQVEMRLVIEADGKPVSETWLYRWTP